MCSFFCSVEKVLAMLAVVVAERDRGDGGKVWFIARNFLVSPLFALYLILNILKCILVFSESQMGTW